MNEQTVDRIRALLLQARDHEQQAEAYRVEVRRLIREEDRGDEPEYPHQQV